MQPVLPLDHSAAPATRVRAHVTAVPTKQKSPRPSAACFLRVLPMPPPHPCGPRAAVGTDGKRLLGPRTFPPWPPLQLKRRARSTAQSVLAGGGSSWCLPWVTLHALFTGNHPTPRSLLPALCGCPSPEAAAAGSTRWTEEPRHGPAGSSPEARVPASQVGRGVPSFNLTVLVCQQWLRTTARTPSRLARWRADCMARRPPRAHQPGVLYCTGAWEALGPECE